MALDLLRTVLSLLVGYLVGSLPLAAWVGRAGGVGVARQGEGPSGPADVWRQAGPGWGVLALTGDLAKGILPVAIGIVTFTWWTGWVAGVGVLAGAGWPAFGRLAGGRGVATLAGILVALAPLAGAVSLTLAIPVAVAAHVLGRNGRIAGTVAGLSTFPLLFIAEQRDVVRLVGLGLLSLVAVARYAVARR